MLMSSHVQMSDEYVLENMSSDNISGRDCMLLSWLQFTEYIWGVHALSNSLKSHVYFYVLKQLTSSKDAKRLSLSDVFTEKKNTVHCSSNYVRTYATDIVERKILNLIIIYPVPLMRNLLLPFTVSIFSAETLFISMIIANEHYSIQGFISSNLSFRKFHQLQHPPKIYL